MPPFRIGTRRSKLALWQANWVAGQLRRYGHQVELVELVTQGDQEQTGPLASIGGEGLFTKEIQRALLAHEVDLAVHSLKDLPTGPTPGLVVAAVPKRESPDDVLVSNKASCLALLPAGARIGTGSPRRVAQLKHVRPDVNVLPIRGNVDTRLRKLDEQEYDGIVLAEAGLVRLGLAERITEWFSPEVMLSAVGQGALGLECRDEDQATIGILNQLNDPASYKAVLAERTLLAGLRAGCSAPVGAFATIQGNSLKLQAVVLSSNGRERIYRERCDHRDNAEQLGRKLSEELLAEGAAELIASVKQ